LLAPRNDVHTLSASSRTRMSRYCANFSGDDNYCLLPKMRNNLISKFAGRLLRRRRIYSGESLCWLLAMTCTHSLRHREPACRIIAGIFGQAIAIASAENSNNLISEFAIRLLRRRRIYSGESFYRLLAMTCTHSLHHREPICRVIA
jgi:hypothetical protein